MCSHRGGARPWSAGVAALLVMTVGCSQATSPPPPTSSTTAAPPPRASPPGVSPGGVTTEVDAPSDATESQYGQACRAATLWMDTQPGDRRQLIEPYLAQLQTPEAVGPGTFGTTWALLSRAQQAGVVMAVEAAADGECG
ncbi:lipoprotein LpqV [Mycolicibacterium murale]|uniref:lipoprotein LpqV n=1 Tax=Mycolicibacterium murale TaxID=182220 RepID=UPI001875BC65|nr:lipoprotein LpqV [Mycolicibacterium murale]MCV7183927.1 lipoprotein LpqV [Mycolicibacterium murale]